MAKKRKGKYPNLDPSQNTKSRTDYIDTEYINGVTDVHGEEVIRPLNAEEKAWLNKFYGEYVAVSDRQLNPSDEIMEYMKQKSECKKRIAKIRKETKVKENQEIVFLLSKIEEIEKALDFLRKEADVFHPTCEEQRELYNTNNTRNFCVYNNLKARGMLIDLTTETIDSFVANYWDVLLGFDYDSQDRLIEVVEDKLRAEGYLPAKRDPEDFSDTSTDSNKKRKKS